MEVATGSRFSVKFTLQLEDPELKTFNGPMARNGIATWQSDYERTLLQALGKS